MFLLLQLLKMCFIFGSSAEFRWYCLRNECVVPHAPNVCRTLDCTYRLRHAFHATVVGLLESRMVDAEVVDV